MSGLLDLNSPPALIKSAVDPSQPKMAPTTPSDRSLARSIAWNAASDWGTQIFTWLAFLEVMRLLTPADFGIAAMAGLLMPYLGQLCGLGFGRAVVVLRDLSDDQLAQMNTVNSALGVALFLLAAIFAKPFAAFFKTPRLAPVFIVTCSSLILSALCAVPSSSLAKELRFRFLSVLGATVTMIAAIATLILALLGFGYWAIVLGNLFASLVRAVVILWVRPCRFVRPHLSSLREPIRFGRDLSVSMVALNSYQRLDNFVAGRVLGESALGFYGTAWELANIPIEKVTSLVTTVIASYLSAVQDQPAALRRYVRGLTEVIALATFPATIGLSLVAREFVPLIFGHKWDGMIAPLQVLSFYAAFRSVMALMPKVLTAVGNIRYVMWNDVLALVLLPVSFYIGSYRGTVGIAWAWVVAYPFIVLPLYRKTFIAIDMRLADYLRALKPALSGTVALIIGVECVKRSLPSNSPLLVRLVVEVAVGVLVYVGTLWLLHRDRVGVLIETARTLWPRGARLRCEPAL